MASIIITVKNHCWNFKFYASVPGAPQYQPAHRMALTFYLNNLLSADCLTWGIKGCKDKKITYISKKGFIQKYIAKYTVIPCEELRINHQITDERVYTELQKRRECVDTVLQKRYENYGKFILF